MIVIILTLVKATATPIAIVEPKLVDFCVGFMMTFK